MELLIGAIWGIFFQYNVSKTEVYKCKIEKQQAACEQLAEPKK
jgi:hypothetical protein